MRPTQPRSHHWVLYLLYLALIAACSLGAGVWLSAHGYALLASTAGLPSSESQAAHTAFVETTPAPSSTPLPTSTPQPGAERRARPTPSLAPSPTPTPARPRASQASTRIVVPAIHLDAPVVEIGYRTTYLGDIPVAEWQLPANAAGFHLGSAYPGNVGNTVLSGHNNIQGEVFRYLVDLRAGDEVTLYVGSTPYRYRVSIKEILPEKGQPAEVRIANARRIDPTADERLTLVTCWPYTGNSHRVIVTAFPIP